MKVHTALGPGLLESAYEACLAYELRKGGLNVETQVPLPVIYDGVRIDVGYRIDLIVAEVVIVELKSVDKLTRGHQVDPSGVLSGLGRSVWHSRHLVPG